MRGFRRRDLSPMMGSGDGLRGSPDLAASCGVPIRRGYAVRRRTDLRREEGVAMTEFALIVPVFMLIVVGMLAFGRVFFYWIEANHLANETARWAVVDRNPDPSSTRSRELSSSTPATTAARSSSPTPRSASPTSAPAARRTLGRAAAGEDREAVHASCRCSRSGRSRSAARRRCGSSASPTERPARTEYGVPGSALPRGVHVSRLRDERGSVLALAAVMIPVFLLLAALVDRRRRLVHAQAAAPEPRRRGRLRSRRRVREELAAVRLRDRRPPSSRRRHRRPEDRRRRAPVRRATPRRPTTRAPPCRDPLKNTEIATQSSST